MDHLPLGDINMLVSSVNFLLRDGEFENLDDICNYYDVPKTDIEARLTRAGYAYSAELNRII